MALSASILYCRAASISDAVWFCLSCWMATALFKILFSFKTFSCSAFKILMDDSADALSDSRLSISAACVSTTRCKSLWKASDLDLLNWWPENKKERTGWDWIWRQRSKPVVWLCFSRVLFRTHVPPVREHTHVRNQNYWTYQSDTNATCFWHRGAQRGKNEIEKQVVNDHGKNSPYVDARTLFWGVPNDWNDDWLILFSESPSMDSSKVVLRLLDRCWPYSSVAPIPAEKELRFVVSKVGEHGNCLLLPAELWLNGSGEATSIFNCWFGLTLARPIGWSIRNATKETERIVSFVVPATQKNYNICHIRVTLYVKTYWQKFPQGQAKIQYHTP